MKLASVVMNTIGRNILRDAFHVEPFTFGLEICQFKIKGTPIYCGGGLFFVVLRFVPCSQLLQNANLMRSIVTYTLVENRADRLYLEFFTSKNPAWIICI